MLTLPQVDFCGRKVSRLIVGGNPFSGNSHISAEIDKKMIDFYTTDRIKSTLAHCVECGINTAQMRGDKHIARIWNEFMNDGYNMNWIAQTASEICPFETSIQLIKRYGAYAAYLHGTITDSLFKEGNIAEIERRLHIMRESGMAVGLGSHMPEVFEYAEEHHWDTDFYMCCLYNISKIDRVSAEISGHLNADEPFDEPDRAIMLSFIRSTSKPCLAFKILGAGRRCTDYADIFSAFSEAYSSIKPSDCVIVGVYPRDHDQILEDTNIVRKLLGDG